jgi:hypothetical protein
MIELITVSLKNRSFYVSIDDENSIMYDLLLGTVQSLILGPIMYAIFVSPLFDICDLTSFAENIYIPNGNYSAQTLILDIKKELEVGIKWLRISGLKIKRAFAC